MAENQAINYYVPIPRPQAQRTPPLPIDADWLQNWLQGKTPDPAVFEHHGFQMQQFYSVVIYRAAGASANGEQFAALLQAEATRRGIKGPVVPYEQSAVLFHPVEEPQIGRASCRERV